MHCITMSRYIYMLSYLWYVAKGLGCETNGIEATDKISHSVN
jgi:hypothetical protein